MDLITSFEEFVNELMILEKSYGFSRRFEDEDLSAGAQQRRRETEQRDDRNRNAARLAADHFNKRDQQKARDAEKIQFTNKTFASASSIKSDQKYGFAFAELLPPVKTALSSLSEKERSAAKVGTASFKQGMDLYYNALNSNSCKETDKAQYHRDAKDCRDLDDLYHLVDMFIEDYFNKTSQPGDKSVFVPRVRKPMESEDERTERKRQNWY
jgi:hypothetical protein